MQPLPHYKAFSLLFVLTLISLFFILGTNTASAQSQPCHGFTQPSHINNYTGFGSPFYEVGDRSLLVKANCGDNNVASIEIGNGRNTMYIYKYAYVWNSDTGWEQRNLSGNTTSNWIIGSANLNNVDVNKYSFMVTRMCTFEGGSWKCGCRDGVCSGSSAGLWQLQRLVPQGSGGGEVDCSSIEYRGRRIETPLMESRFNRTEPIRARADDIYAFKITAPSSGNVNARFSATATAYSPSAKLLNVSSCPGDAMRRVTTGTRGACWNISAEVTSLTLTTNQSANPRDWCILEPGRDYYINASSNAGIDTTQKTCRDNQRDGLHCSFYAEGFLFD